MAGDGEEETEYESDPEEANISLKMRRREASDDEDDDEAEEQEREREVPHPRAGIVDSEGESDGQGGAAEYNEEEEEEEGHGEEHYDVQEEYEEEREISGGGGSRRGDEAEGGVEEVAGTEAVEGTDDGHELMGQSQVEGEEGKKENEPFAVPTSGAFYMHDDRFRNNAGGGRHRRTFGGKKLWESKDNSKWGHDKFEELNLQDRHYEEGKRSSKGYYRGRGKGSGTDRGFTRGNRTRAYGGNNNQNSTFKDVRGRGPRRYQPFMKNKSETLPLQTKQSAKSIVKTAHAGSGRIAASTANPNIEHESLLAKKVASNLNYASPPFYPSGSSNKDISLTQEEVHAGNNKRNLHPSVVDHNVSVPLSNSMSRGKNDIDSIGMEKLQIDDFVSQASAKSLNNVHFLSSASSSLSGTQMPQSRAQGRVVALSGSNVFQPPQTNNQVNKVPPPPAQTAQRTPVQNRDQASLQASGQQLAQHSLGGSQASPPKAGKGKGTAQGAGRGSLMYAGAQVMGSGGNMGAGQGDQNLPAFFPVMQFGAQHPGGIGVPAVGMAFPGYVTQPNGVGNSEMTWLPVLASAAGSLGATYCPPYHAVDETYHRRPTGQTSALPAPSKKDNNLTKPNNEVKPQQRSEVSHDEFNQRQNKPRRYSEMNFSQ